MLGSRQGHPESSGAGPSIDHSPEDQQAWFRSMWEGRSPEDTMSSQEQPSAAQDNEDDFGDDFDEFAEGGDDDDFGDFDEPTPAPEPAARSAA